MGSESLLSLKTVRKEVRAMARAKPKNDKGPFIYRAYVVRNGKRIYPRRAKALRIAVTGLKKRNS
jgi:hypothetical protein